MSLSGLDSPAIEAAVRVVSTERGGWFLIHYLSRDEVDVLASGTKGVAELREAAIKYYKGSDESAANIGPLFGMIDSRRRRVLLKLVPDDTSRLVKARVQVHWASVTARFPNHESVFELTTTDQLTESNVAAHTELHSGRSSAGSNNKKPVLDGISEEGAEEKPSPLAPGRSSSVASTEHEHQVSPLSNHTDSNNNMDHSKRISALINKTNATSAALQESITKSPATDLSPVPEVSVTSFPPASEVPQEWSQDTRPSTDSRSLYEPGDRRLSTQSGRPSTATDSHSLYDLESLYKPKVKLGPRPATASRPSSKSTHSAALPSGLRASRPPSLRPKSRDSTYSAYRAPPPPPIPETSPLDFMPRPRSSGQSVKSLPATLPKSPGMTREKQRLMKFREMYKEKENKRAKDKAKVEEQTPRDGGIPIVIAPEMTDEGNEESELAATVSMPQEDLAPRLSVISEASSMVSRSPGMSTADRSMFTKDATTGSTDNSAPPTPLTSIAANTPALAQDELPDGREDHVEVNEPRQSSEESALPASSPTSFMDSSETTNSTRATSVTEGSDRGSHEADAEEDDIPRQTIMQTPVEAPETDEESQSSTPTAAPIEAEKPVQPEDKEKEKEKEKRRAAVAPLQIPHEHHHDIASEAGTEHSLEHDDNLMDELDGAEVQEAFSMSVTKSPITPFFNRRPSSAHTPVSPVSLVLTDKTPLPSPLPRGFDRTMSKTGATPTTRTPSGSMLKDGLLVTQEQPKFPSPEPGQTEKSKKRISNEFVEDDRRTTMTPDKFKSSRTVEVSSTQVSPRKASSPADVRRKSSKKSRTSIAAKMLGSRDKSPSNMTNPSISRTSSLLSPTSDDGLSVHKRRNVSSGVAAKIADLQRNLSKASTISPPPQPTSRKSSMVSMGEKTPPRSANSHFRDEHLFRGRAMSKGSMRSFESKETGVSTPPRNKSSGSVGKLDSRRFTTFNNPALEVSSKPDTIQVKATIIRADMDRSADTTGLGLQHTPVEGEHPKSVQEPYYAQPRTSIIVEEPRSPARTSMDRAHRRARSSISSALGLIGIRGSSPQRSSENAGSPIISEGRRSARTSLDISSGMRSLRRRASASLSRSPSITRESAARSPSQQGRYSPMPLTPMTIGSAQSAPAYTRSMSSSSLESSATTDYDGESTKHKRKGSRASRMLKRMSNSMSSIMHSGNSERPAPNNIVPTVEEEKWVGADLGEMNVQFPDTLLWKRRHLEIDTQGYLVLNPHDTSKARGSDKLERRYHLNQFFPPFAPDMERMEMPHSVVLDFRDDGGTLQVAANSGSGQSGLLRVLSEAHRVCSY